MPEDYYKVLEVSRKANSDELKRAYRKKALQFHPDRNKKPDAEARFKLINEAYHVLSDANRRRNYDAFGHAGLKNGGGSSFGGFDININDIFESFFGGGQERSAGYGGPMAGSDLGYELEVELEDVVKGTQKKFTIEILVHCDECDSTGAQYGSDPLPCQECDGTGQVTRVQRLLIGQVKHTVGCPHCEGRGVTINNPCSICHGAGRRHGKSTIELKIPPGIDNGTRLSLRGKGDAGERGAPTGDLIVSVFVREHKKFKRRRRDLVVRQGINFAEAALGAEIEIETLDGAVSATVKSGTQHGDTIVLKNHGLPPLGREAPRGDLIVQLEVYTPTKLNNTQKELLIQLADTFKESGKGVFKRIKDSLSSN